MGEFQEIVLLSILILDEEAYGMKIQQEISQRLDRTLSRGALHTALSRLEEKGFITEINLDKIEKGLLKVEIR